MSFFRKLTLNDVDFIDFHFMFFFDICDKTRLRCFFFSRKADDNLSD